MSDVTDVLKEYSKDIIKTIEENLAVIEPEELQESSIYLTRAGGKMLRPSLALISSQAVGGNKEDALNTAAAIELIHTFSLIHDDIMDDDDMRRGNPSCHKKFGEDIALVAGDTLLTEAFFVASGANLPAEKIVKAINLRGVYYEKVKSRSYRCGWYIQ